jgi:hypothetical protein
MFRNVHFYQTISNKTALQLQDFNLLAHDEPVAGVVLNQKSLTEKILRWKATTGYFKTPEMPIVKYSLSASTLRACSKIHSLQK